MSRMYHFTEANFSVEVLQSCTPVLVYFISPHCAPCKMVTPIVTQLTEEWGDQVKVGTLDIFESFKTTLRYVVMKAPTLILFIDGKPVERAMGFMTKAQFLAKFEPHLS